MIVLLDAVFVLVLVLAATIQDRKLRIPIAPDRIMDLEREVTIVGLVPGGQAEVLYRGTWLLVTEGMPWRETMLTLECDANCESRLAPYHIGGAYVVVGETAKDIAFGHIRDCVVSPVDCGVPKGEIGVDGWIPVPKN